MLSLPPRLGGIGVVNPCNAAEQIPAQSINCKEISSPLIQTIQQRGNENPEDVILSQQNLKCKTRQQNHQELSNLANKIKATLPQKLSTAMENTSVKGASSLLTVVSIEELGFKLHKQAFRDALCLRYGWPLSCILSHGACGVPFSVNHAFSCPKGGFPTIRHNQIRDLLVELLSEVCPCVSVEPALQPLSGESIHRRSAIEDNARLDACARNFWDKSRSTTSFDVKVFNALAVLNSSSSASSCFRKHKLDKRRKYRQGVCN